MAAIRCCLLSGILTASFALSGCTGDAPAPSPTGSASPSTAAPSGATSAPPVNALPTASAAPLPQGRAQEIESALKSAQLADLQKAVALPTTATLSPDVLAALKGIKNLHLDPSTFHPISASSAVIDGSTEGQQWLVYLVLDAGVWKIAATEPK
jgi:hypothetical protein